MRFGTEFWVVRCLRLPVALGRVGHQCSVISFAETKRLVLELGWLNDMSGAAQVEV